ncbi:MULTISPECIES: hypothetical protein [Haloferax]|uniref:Uncharacterized protein n=1 Tax=Haloferax mediterranei (strain ATCC 33500 / DSM 1411 / JCM 8866 / NBRC 14739 / NCIMB 2177 / R-4) TaxID=523841 RepID=M0J7S2_HALMT|nr:hypothetical protein [Haloferax mediterranei]AHZ24117.1 hypothetical protein BM92_18095 [Haloferax mediterranei ATCC 33500]EMA05192.1 hypothetical protein C439_00295 [Haloferax mediterranei ATCC 33500]
MAIAISGASTGILFMFVGWLMALMTESPTMIRLIFFVPAVLILFGSLLYGLEWARRRTVD